MLFWCILEFSNKIRILIISENIGEYEGMDLEIVIYDTEIVTVINYSPSLNSILFFLTY